MLYHHPATRNAIGEGLCHTPNGSDMAGETWLLGPFVYVTDGIGSRPRLQFNITLFIFSTCVTLSCTYATI